MTHVGHFNFSVLDKKDAGLVLNQTFLALEQEANKNFNSPTRTGGVYHNSKEEVSNLLNDIRYIYDHHAISFDFKHLNIMLNLLTDSAYPNYSGVNGLVRLLIREDVINFTPPAIEEKLKTAALLKEVVETIKTSYPNNKIQICDLVSVFYQNMPNIVASDDVFMTIANMREDHVLYKKRDTDYQRELDALNKAMESMLDNHSSHYNLLPENVRYDFKNRFPKRRDKIRDNRLKKHLKDAKSTLI